MSSHANSPAKTNSQSESLVISHPVTLYCAYLAAGYYDRAKEIADRERELCKGNASLALRSLVYSLLSQLCAVEKQYMSVGFLATKRFLIKEQSLACQYSTLYNDISKAGDLKKCDAAANSDQEFVSLSDDIKHFLKARIALVDFYTTLSHVDSLQQPPPPPSSVTQAVAMTMAYQDTGPKLPLDKVLIPAIDEIQMLYGTCLAADSLRPLQRSFLNELRAMRSFLHCLQHMARWDCFQALMTLDKGKECLNEWQDQLSTPIRETQNSSKAVPDGGGGSRLKLFDSWFRSPGLGSNEQVEPLLYQWFLKLKLNLWAKFSLYFFQVLLARTSLHDMKTRCAQNTSDHVAKILAFQKRVDACAVCICYDGTGDRGGYRGPGFHYPDKAAAANFQGLELFPVAFMAPIVSTDASCTPPPSLAKYWPTVVKLISDKMKECECVDRIVNVNDQRLNATYFAAAIEPLIYVLVIFDGTNRRPEPDHQVHSFLLDLICQLRCIKIFASLNKAVKL